MDFAFTRRAGGAPRARRGAGSTSATRTSGSPSSPTPTRAGTPRRGRSSPELGWLGVSVSEDEGGAGLGFLEEAVLFEELGRALYPGPYFSTVALALPALAAEAARDGRRGRGALVGAGRRARPRPRARRPRARRARRQLGRRGRGRDRWRRWTRRAGSGGSRTAAREGGDAAIDRIRARATRARARGGRDRAARARLGASSTRRTAQQFGKSIGVYQAVSHSLADAMMATELARSLAYWAAWCVAEGDDAGADSRPPRPRRTPRDAAVSACERSIQVHGGIGFTWEHPLHRYYKRAQWIQALRRVPGRAAGRGRRRDPWLSVRPDHRRLLRDRRRLRDAARTRGAGRCYAGVRTPGDAPAGTTEVILDVTDAAARSTFERLDGLVNNAGIAIAAPLEDLPLDELRRQLEVNVVGQLAVTQAVLPALRAAKGRIVIVGSIAGPERAAVPRRLRDLEVRARGDVGLAAARARARTASRSRSSSPGRSDGDLDEAAAAAPRSSPSGTATRVERFRADRGGPGREGRAGRPRLRCDRARAHRRAPEDALPRRPGREDPRRGSRSCPTATRDRVLTRALLKG